MNSSNGEGLGILFFTAAALVSPAHVRLGARPLYASGGKLEARPWVQDLFSWVVKTLLTWGERHRQRRGLAELDDHLLRDIGLTRARARAEVDKPFWRP